jgi:hypothetical protein
MACSKSLLASTCSQELQARRKFFAGERDDPFLDPVCSYHFSLDLWERTGGVPKLRQFHCHKNIQPKGARAEVVRAQWPNISTTKTKSHLVLVVVRVVVAPVPVSLLFAALHLIESAVRLMLRL